MIKFINAKLNLGLNIIRRRPDGYHDLETIFYPVGIHNGTPENPEPFCDILEIKKQEHTEFVFTGNHIDCPLEKNLVHKAWAKFKEHYPALDHYRINIDKHLPDGAGLGGGSADAAFVLTALNELSGFPFGNDVLARMALGIGADCPFFLYNKPAFAQGVGEALKPLALDLSGKWCVLVKPELSVSTKEAFAGVTPKTPVVSLEEIARMRIEEWKDLMHNDFEDSLFPKYPVLNEIKQMLYMLGASYSAMSGSGSTVFGLFDSKDKAQKALDAFKVHYTALCML